MKLSLFFTYNISLKNWVESGLFEREKLIYEKHLESGTFSNVFWLTYGPNDRSLAKTLKEQGHLHKSINVVPMPKIFRGKLGTFLYSLILPLWQYKSLLQADILKTNQISGSWTAVLSRWLYRRPLVVRTGYTWSILKKRCNAPYYKQKLIGAIESLAYKNAEMAVVTSKCQSRYISERYRISEEKIHVVPNYVNTQLFKPDDSADKYENRIIFVGRLSDEKNLFNLVEAIAKTNLTLDIYGQGPLKEQLEEYAGKSGAAVNFMGILPNDKLPGIFNRYRYYILPSYDEGMPKSLLEAMACGLICIGSDAKGIREIIEDEVNGYLAKGTDATALVQVIKKATHPAEDLVAREAVKTIRNKFSIETILEQEEELIGNLQI